MLIGANDRHVGTCGWLISRLSFRVLSAVRVLLHERCDRHDIGRVLCLFITTAIYHHCGKQPAVTLCLLHLLAHAHVVICCVDPTAMEKPAVSRILWRSALVESLVDTVAAMVHDSGHYEGFRRWRDLRVLDAAGMDGLASFLSRAQAPED